MSEDDLVVRLRDEVIAYKEIITKEIHNHKLFSQVTAATATGLLILGAAIAYFSTELAALGYLLAIVGVLRFLNTFYDLQREDGLKRSFRSIEERFRKREA